MILLPGAVWRGPIPNKTPSGVQRPFLGCVLHITGSSFSAADGWFHNPSAQASAHFIVDYDGTTYQEVSLDDKAWAEAAGNPYYVSIETVGISTTEPLTNAQVVSVAKIYAFVHALDNIPFTLAEAPGQRGFGWHGMGGNAWGGHPYCPGEPRKAQRPLILSLAQGQHPVPQRPKEEDMLLQVDPGKFGRIPVDASKPYRLIMVSDFKGATVRSVAGSQRSGVGFHIEELWIPGWRVGWDNSNLPGVDPKKVEIFGVDVHPDSGNPCWIAVEYP